MNEEVNGYTLSRDWFDYCFENPEKIKPRHTALYFFAIEHCNRLGWKKKFGLPSTMAMEAIGISSYNTYKKTFDDLVEWGFIKLIQKSENQYSSNKIALSKFDKPLAKSLDKALSKHASNHSETTDSINKQTNKGTIEQGNSAREISETSEALPIPEQIQQAKNVQALCDIWYAYRGRKAKGNPRLHNPDLTEIEMTRYQMGKWGVAKTKMIMQNSIREGYLSLKEDYLPDGQKDAGSENGWLERPNEAAYHNDYTGG